MAYSQRCRLSGFTGALRPLEDDFRLWVDAGEFERIFKAASADADMENVNLDSTSIRVREKASGAKKRSKR